MLTILPLANIQAQCPLTCTNNSFLGINMVSEVISQSGSPCVIEIRIINNSTFAPVTFDLIDFTLAVCTDCPPVGAGSTAVWTITAGFPCDTPGSSAAIFPTFAAICGNTSVCPLTGVSLLPVEWIHFRAQIQEEQVRLEWMTAAEVNNAGFTVERSPNGIQWENVGFVNGQGTSSVAYNYHFFDAYPLAGVNYYRLQQQDYDGQYEYSDILSVDTGAGDPVVRFFPNPASDRVSLRMENMNSGLCTLRVYDLNGRAVMTEAFYVPGDHLQTYLDLRELAGGVYLTEITSGDRQWNHKIMLR